MSNVATVEMNNLEKGLVIVGTVGSIAPFIGLLGTVWGIWISFREIGLKGGGGIEVVGSGIAQALISTIFGLAVAIPSVFFYNYLANRVNQMGIEIQAAASEIVDSMKDGAAGK